MCSVLFNAVSEKTEFSDFFFTAGFRVGDDGVSGKKRVAETSYIYMIKIGLRELRRLWAAPPPHPLHASPSLKILHFCTLNIYTALG